MNKWSVAGRLCALAGVLAASVTPAVADSSTPVNYVSVNFGPIVSSTSYTYDPSTGALTPASASASVFSTANAVQNSISDPAPDPNGYGTFIGTARPVPSPTGGGAVLFEQSVCPTLTCLNDGSLTYGYMVMYSLRGATVDQLTNLKTMYYVKQGCFGGGSPRFDLLMSNGSEIHVYFGLYPEFADCPPPDTWLSTGQLASDSAGLRWDTSQLCPGTFYNTYSGAVTCADTLGLTISAILVSTDGGWASPGGNQTFLFQEIQANNVTRFP